MNSLYGRLLSTGAWNTLFRDHEIYVRTGGHVRFLLLSARLQRRAAAVAAIILAAWLAGTMALLAWQAWTSWKNRDVAERAAAIEMAEARVAAERRSVETIAQSIDARQDQLEALVGAHFGEEPEAAAVPSASSAPTGKPETQSAPVQPGEQAAGKGSAAAVVQASLQTGPAPDPTQNPAADPVLSQVARIKAAAKRQDRLVAALTGAVERRSIQMETVLRRVGIRPSAATARGGPFIPWREGRALGKTDPAIRDLSRKLDRMAQLESLLDALPSGLPAERMELSSGFGYRFDPFNGQRALHAGLDFTGAYGSPIRAAAAGRITFAGVKSGYGNVIEIDHGHGIETRYAHLAGFTARAGQTVDSGQQIGRMGSTGRSTGTHLHFEVRVGGNPVNPRRFLEANSDVLEAKADPDSRSRTSVAAG